MIDVVAELGACHDGFLRQFCALIDVAADAGCTYVKAQYWSSVVRMVARRHAESYRDIYARYQMPRPWLPILTEQARARHIKSACSVYLPEDAEIVAPYVDAIKISSFESSDDALLRACESTGKPLIISAGMVDDEELSRLCARVNGLDARILHCVSAYPASLDGALHRLSVAALDGFSDHTHNIWTGAVAVGCGARIIEVHVRLEDTDPENPDYATALDPSEFFNYAQGVRTAERLIADVPVDESAMRPFKVRP